MPEEDSKNIIKELITHINNLEEKIKSLSESIFESKDLVMVNKLDIINLKNQTEKIKLSIPNISPDTLGRLREMEEMADGPKQKDKWKELVKEIDVIKSQLQNKKQKDLDDIAAGMEFINQRLDKFESVLNDVTTKQRKEQEKKHEEHAKAIIKLHQKLGKIEEKTSVIRHCKECGKIVENDARFCNKCGSKV